MPRDAADLARPAGPREAVRLVAIDLDGTLLRSDKRLSVRCVEAIAAATRQGVRVVLASARPPRTVREIYHRLGLDTVQVNYNGALIHDMPRRRNVFHQPLDIKLARKVVRCARKADANVVVSVEILDKWYTDRVDPSLLTETSRFQDPDFIGPLDSFMHVPATKVMLLAPPERLAPVREAVARRCGRQVAVMVSDHHLLQVVHPKVNKAAALAEVARRYGIEQGEVMAIGDAPNDAEMLRWAGWGVAVGNAWPAARDAADAVVASNDEDGVAAALDAWVLCGEPGP